MSITQRVRGGDGRLQRVGREPEAVFLAAGQHHRLAAEDGDDIGVGHPEGRGDDHLVARIEGRHHGVEDHLLGTRRGGHLVLGED
ncbi:hypothetical protein QE440_000971 [Pseudomonas psychrotolerans]|uniref:Uncharacterized protein n=1 Tax=Pseudomonas oryzihabitans TaxID=47885 RepID=A0AAJ2BIU7_9PSED|nr:hypothetical protein [Pseudomonas psychrotolerans]